MKITREFRLPTWDDREASVVADYLRSRGFRDAQLLREEPGVTVTGARGGWIGNFTSFDMRRLRTRVHVSGDVSGRVRVELNVTTFGQHVTDWNRAFWRLELIELCAVASGEAPIGDVWARYHGPRRRAAILWTLSGAVFGRRLSPAWVAELERLEQRFANHTEATSLESPRAVAERRPSHH